MPSCCLSWHPIQTLIAYEKTALIAILQQEISTFFGACLFVNLPFYQTTKIILMRGYQGSLEKDSIFDIVFIVVDNMVIGQKEQLIKGPSTSSFYV
jgi:hypothetical protein